MNMNRILFWLQLIVALIIGYAIYWVDARPTWDDAGITAARLIIASALMGTAAPQWAWFWALAIGGWFPLMGIIHSGNFRYVLILGFAFLGAYAGAYSRKTLASFVDGNFDCGIGGNQ